VWLSACIHGKFIDRATGSQLASNTPMTGSAGQTLKPIQRPQAGRVIVTAVLLAACTTPLFARMPHPQRHERRHEIDHLEEVWRDAVLKDDTAAMSGLLSDDYIAITPNGTLQTKEEVLADLKSGRTHVTNLEVYDRKVRFYGSTALVTSLADVQATTGEGDMNGSYRYTRVYVQDPQGVWKIVSFEANRVVGAPAEHK
jgi:ketosteroid isomerase-like protein